MHSRLARRLAGALFTAVTLSAATVTVAAADTIVSVGDSAISGESGRWAGNIALNGNWSDTDTGADAYNDAGGAESQKYCHRSKSAQVHIGGGVTSVNLACSGSRVDSYIEEKTGGLKP